MAGEALAHLRVVELCNGLPAFYCGRQFAAWGAAVTSVEPTGGSPLRRLSPAATGPDGERLSLVWHYAGANKRTLTLDLARPADLAALREQVLKADVFLTDR